jgi:hypothetical protein
VVLNKDVDAIDERHVRMDQVRYVLHKLDETSIKDPIYQVWKLAKYRLRELMVDTSQTVETSKKTLEDPNLKTKPAFEYQLLDELKGAPTRERAEEILKAVYGENAMTMAVKEVQHIVAGVSHTLRKYVSDAAPSARADRIGFLDNVRKWYRSMDDKLLLPDDMFAPEARAALKKLQDEKKKKTNDPPPTWVDDLCTKAARLHWEERKEQGFDEKAVDWDLLQETLCRWSKEFNPDLLKEKAEKKKETRKTIEELVASKDAKERKAAADILARQRARLEDWIVEVGTAKEKGGDFYSPRDLHLLERMAETLAKILAETRRASDLVKEK